MPFVKAGRPCRDCKSVVCYCHDEDERTPPMTNDTKAPERIWLLAEEVEEFKDIEAQAARIEELEAENARLREALRSIDELSRRGVGCGSISRAALQEGGQKEPFSEYGHYGENNPPVGMSSPGDKDYEV